MQHFVWVNSYGPNFESVGMDVNDVLAKWPNASRVLKEGGPG
jgi:hypothetical protein